MNGARCEPFNPSLQSRPQANHDAGQQWLSPGSVDLTGYRDQMFEMAKVETVLSRSSPEVSLEVAVLLMKHLREADVEKNKRKVSVIVSSNEDRASLALQAVEKFSDLTAERCLRESDSFSSDCLVTTPFMFNILLRGKLIKMCDVSLLFLDDCFQRAMKDSMNEMWDIHFENCAVEERPKIFACNTVPRLKLQNTGLSRSVAPTRLIVCRIDDSGNLKAMLHLPSQRPPGKFQFVEEGQKIPSAFQDRWDGEKGWLILLQFDDEHNVNRVLDIGLIVPGKPPDCLADACRFMLNHEVTTLRMHFSCRPVELSGRIDDLMKYGATLWSTILKRPYSLSVDNAVYLPVPLLSSGEEALVAMQNGEPFSKVIDWDSVMDVQDVTNVNDPVLLFELFGDELVVNSLCGDFFRVFSVERDRRPHSTPFFGHPSVEEFFKSRSNSSSCTILRDQPLLSAIPIPNIYQSATSQNSMAGSFIYLIPQFCKAVRIPSTLLIRSALYLPLIIRAIHHSIIVHDFWTTFRLESCLSLNHMLNLTSTLAEHSSIDRERATFLGLCFGKLVSGLHLYCTYPLKDEGVLTAGRNKLMSPSHFFRQEVMGQLSTALGGQVVSQETWLPPTWESFMFKVQLPMSTQLVSMIFGACFIHSGLIGAAAAAERLLAWEGLNADWSKYLDMLRGQPREALKHVFKGTRVEAKRFDRVKAIAEMLGYEFKDPYLLLEATTHSCGSSGPQYQRLEFFGDAVLEYALAVVFDKKNMSTKSMAHLRQKLCSNQFLGVAACSIGFHTQLICENSFPFFMEGCNCLYETVRYLQGSRRRKHYNRQLQRRDFGHPYARPTTAVSTRDNTEMDELKRILGLEMYFKDSSSLVKKAPKIVCDCFEAILEAVEGVINKVLIDPWWFVIEEYIDNPAPAEPPNGYLGEMKGITNRALRKTTKSASSLSYSCSLGRARDTCIATKHDIIIGVGVGTSVNAAQKDAAKKAVPYLKEFKAYGDVFCNCADPNEWGEHFNAVVKGKLTETTATNQPLVGFKMISGVGQSAVDVERLDGVGSLYPGIDALDNSMNLDSLITST
ncbi:Dicer-like protein 2 [Dinochytrium kinnereticum]|nr:Dicer-like protein 2 [Dinochytrium kinnereticum]